MTIESIPIKSVLILQSGAQIGAFIGLDVAGVLTQDAGDVLRLTQEPGWNDLSAENDGAPLPGVFTTLNLIGGGGSSPVSDMLRVEPSAIFRGGVVARNLTTTRSNASALDSSKDGVDNLGTDTSGIEAGAAASFCLLLGDRCSATGSYAGAGGYFTVASNVQSFAWGHTNVASGAQSACFGWLSSASGDRSFAAGFSCAASQQGAVALGYGSIASGFGSTSIGNANTASGFASFAANYLCAASGFASTALGKALRSRLSAHSRAERRTSSR